jgi:autotransporter-associated beta strand protein
MFGATGVGTVTVSGTNSIGTGTSTALTFSSPGYTLTGGTLALPLGTFTSTFQVNSDATIASILILSAPSTNSVLKKGSGTLTLNPGAGNTDSMGSLAVQAGTLTVSSGTLSVTTSGGANAGSTGAGLVISGSGSTLAVAGGTVNTTGYVSVNSGGTLSISSGTFNSNLGEVLNGYASGNGTVTLSGGLMNVGTLRVTHGNGTGIVNLNGGLLKLYNFNYNGNGPGTVNFNGSTVQALNSQTAFTALGNTYNVLTGGAIFDTAGFNITIAAPLKAGTPSGGLTKQGAGTLTLTTNNTYTGATTVTNGTLTLSGAAGTLSGTTGITVQGGGILIDGDNTTPANNNGVTDRIKNTAGLTLGGASGGGIFTMAFPSSGTHAQTLGSLTIAEGVNTINTTNTAAGTLNLTFAGGEGGYLRTSSKSFLKVVTATGFTPGFAVAPTDATGVSVAGTVNPILIDAFLNNTDFIAAAAGTMAAPAYQTTWAAGETNNNINVTSALTAGNTSVNSLRFNDATARTLTLKTSGITTNTIGMILVGSSAGINSTITGGTLTSGNGSELIVTDFRDTQAIRDLNAMFKLLSTIADNGTTPISLTLRGGSAPVSYYMANGQIQLGNSNTFTGGTTLNKCSVVVSADGAFGAVPASAQADNIRIIDGGYIKTGAAFTLNANRGISLVNNATLTLDSQSGTLTVNGVISGTGTVCGPANRFALTILKGSNTFSGMLSIQNYVRADDGVGLSPNANLSLSDNQQGRGTLQTYGTFTRSVGTGSGQVQWGGVYNNCGGFSAVGGPLTINLGGQATPSALTWGQTGFSPVCLVLQDGNADALLTWLNPINLGTASRSLNVAFGKTAVLAGELSGSGGGISLDIDAATSNLDGTLILAATNTYTGTTTINAGTLQVGNGGSTGTLGGGLVNINTNQLVFNRSNSYNVTNLIKGAGALVQNGTGTLTLSNTNSFSGLTTVSNGTLAAGCDLALKAGNALTLSGGTFDAGSYSNALSTLTLSTGTASMMSVNTGTCKLSFTGLSGTGTLAITGKLGPNTLRFGTTSTALTTAQLNLIRANNRKVYLDSNGYLLMITDGTMVRFF